MAARGWREWLVVLAVSLLGLTGCHLGVSQNPSYFPYLWPTGDIIPTHARPPGHGYYANFDPYAVRVVVRPLSEVEPVQTQHVIVATVYGDNKPLRKRRVEWYLEGEGNIIQVDESGRFPGRGYQKDSKYAVSYTNYGYHRITRGTADPRDDFEVRPGQSWCVVSSAVEGDSYLTVVAPGIYNWDQRRVTVNIKWVDVQWEFPQPTQVRTGTQHVLTTKIFRHTTKEPLANYKVRYRIIEGPPAVFVPQQTQEAVVVSDLSGNAHTAIAQAGPAPGVNKIEVEIIRPPDPTKPSGSGVVVAKAFTTVEWLAPHVEMSHVGPASVALGAEVPYTITITNTGKVPSETMTVTNPIPAELKFVRSNPPSVEDGINRIWTLGPLEPGHSHTIQTVFRAKRIGTINNCAVVATEDGQKDQKCATTIVTRPALKLDVKGPPTGVLGAPLTFDVTLSNPGSGPANNVQVKVDLSDGLEPQGLPAGQEKTRVVLSDQKTVASGESRVIPLTVVPREEGLQLVRISVTGDGGLRDQVESRVQISRPQISVKLAGPGSRYTDRTAEWNIHVINPSSVPLNNVMVSDRLPVNLIFQSASDGGVFKNGEVTWDLGTLPAGKERIIQLSTLCGPTPGFVTHTVTVTSDYGLRQKDTAQMEIKALPASLELEVSDVNDPVAVGKTVDYKIEVTNTGNKPATNVRVVATLPKELQAVQALQDKGDVQNATARVEKQTATLTIPALAPKKTVRFTIQAKAVSPGDVRFEAKLYADILKQPAVHRESTTIFDPNAKLNAQPVGGGGDNTANGAPTLRRPIVPPVAPPPLPGAKGSSGP